MISDDAPRPIDRHFGAALVRWAAPQPAAADAALIERLGMVLSMELGRQNSCLPLDALPGDDWPAAAHIAAVLHAHGLTTDEAPGAPLVLEMPWLYLARLHRHEVGIAAALHARARAPGTLQTGSLEALAARLDRLFPGTDEEVDWQRVGAAMAVARPLAVITGGPGTGKTTTVTRLLVLLLAQAGDAPLRVRLAAPTGKAAARLTESIRASRQRLLDDGLCSEAEAAALPAVAETLHRLLGYRPLENGFRHGPRAPIGADLVVVDEASMVDVRLMAQLLSALAPSTRLILLGDKDQLSSVEAGRVLGDLCAWTETHFETRRLSTAAATTLGALTGHDLGALAAPDVPPLADCLCLLRRSHRFDAASAIGRFAAAVNAGDAGAAHEALRAGDASLLWSEAGEPEDVVAAAVAGYREALMLAAVPGADPGAALEAFGRFQVLCATRGGPFGVARINAAVEAAFRRDGLIPAGDVRFAGQPVMVTVNDYAAGLFNGDTGVLLRDPDGQLRAWFMGPDRTLRALRPTRLPHHETVFAMTVHKSQGSEFDAVEVVLPAAPGDNERRLLTRELLYTAATRARSRVHLHALPAVLDAAVAHRTRRASGLRERLWPGEALGSD